MLVYIIIAFEVGYVSAVVLEMFRRVGIFQTGSWLAVLLPYLPSQPVLLPYLPITASKQNVKGFM